MLGKIPAEVVVLSEKIAMVFLMDDNLIGLED